MINRYGPCWGITLYRFFQYRAELWFIPKNYTIVEHRHPQESVELMFIFGRTEFYRRNIYTCAVDTLATTWRCFGRCFSVNSYHSHWFKTNSWPLVFINFQKFFPGIKPKSAAKDFLV